MLIIFFRLFSNASNAASHIIIERGFSTLLTLLFEALLNQMMKCELTNFIEQLFFYFMVFTPFYIRCELGKC